MSKRLPVPPELEHLIEKRDEDVDRRVSTRRKSGSAAPGSGESAAKPERRTQGERRKKGRRKSSS